MRIHALKFCLLCIVALSAQTRYAHATPILEQQTPSAQSFIFGVDFSQLQYSPLGNVTSPTSAVDTLLGLGNQSTSGCDAADFAGFPAGNIALLQQSGVCSFASQALSAEAAGASGVLIFSQGDTVARQGLLTGTLGAGFSGTIPVFGLTYNWGATFASTPNLTFRMMAEKIDENSVPTPATLALLGLGLAGLGWSRRKKA